MALGNVRLRVRRAEYLQCRRGRWFVRLRVPAHLAARVGQTHFVRSLDTNSEAVARERRWTALALLWDWIGGQTVTDGWEPAWAAGLTDLQRSPNGGDKRHPDSAPERGLDHEPDRARQNRRTSQARSQDHTILTLMERWLAEIEGSQKKQSLMMHCQTALNIDPGSASNFDPREPVAGRP